MSECRPEIHVNDTTLFRIRALDNCLDFDPSDAIVKELWFSTPSGVIVKTATLTTDGSPATQWFLEYQVVPGDGLGSPPAEFNATSGRIKVQFHLEWADGSVFTSTVETEDSDGRELRVYSNLA